MPNDYYTSCVGHGLAQSFTKFSSELLIESDSNSYLIFVVVVVIVIIIMYDAE